MNELDSVTMVIWRALQERDHYTPPPSQPSASLQVFPCP
jgi:hypothetical protein